MQPPSEGAKAARPGDATAARLPATYVRPKVGANVTLCGECSATMQVTEYREFRSRRRWIFWRCTADSDHITCAVPLPPA